MRLVFLNKIISKFSLMLIITFTGNCLAGEKINQSIAVNADGKVFVEIPRGLVNIQGWDKQEIMVQGELEDTAKSLTFKTKKDKTLIKINTGKQQTWGDASLLKIFIPQQTSLHFKGIDTSFVITKLNKHIEGKSINGDLKVSQSHGKIRLSVVSGNIKIVDSSGLIKIESVSGDVDFSGNFEEAYLKTMAGDITADISGLDKLAIKNISGETQIRGQVKKEAELKLTSVSGDIVYMASSELNAECEMVSQFGGEITNQLTDDLPVDGNLHKKTLSFISGDGSGTLSMNTVTGSVTIYNDDEND
jgi:hypothetical protein